MSISKMKLGEGNTKISKSQLKKLLSTKDESIDDSDSLITQEMLDKATSFKKANKIITTIRFDAGALTFVKKTQGRGYQTLINNLLVEWAKHNGYKQM